MLSSSPSLRWRQFALAALIALIPPVSLGQGAAEYRIRDHTGVGTFVVAADELLISRSGRQPGELATEIAGKLPEAKLVTDFGTKAFVTVPPPRAGATVTRLAEPVLTRMPGSDVQPVLYRKGAPRNAATRRFGSNFVRVQLPPAESVAQLVARTGAVGTRRTELKGHAILRFADGWRALEAAESLKRGGINADVMLQFVLEPQAIPNDPLFDQQWHLRNIGQRGATFGVDANAVGAWDIATGAGVTMVIVDDSLQTDHPDLAANTPPFDSGLHHDFRDNDDNPMPGVATDRHGTAVAGTAAARQNNAIGTSGSAPDARLLGVRLISGPVTAQDVADALRWEPGNEIASISNNSWGFTGAPDLRGNLPGVEGALQEAAEQGRRGLGQLTFFSNGNSQEEGDNGNYNALANSRFVAAIGAIDSSGVQAYYSTPGANVLVAAPSSGRLGVFTTDGTGDAGYNPLFGGPSDLDYTDAFGGTSAAAPLVAGGAALMLSANPNLGWRDVHEILAATARKIDPTDSDWTTNGGGFHFNHKYGAGMIDLTAAVVRARNWNPLAPETAIHGELSGPVPIPDNGIVTRQLDFSGFENLRIERIEVGALIIHPHRSDLEIALISPSGTRSVLAEEHHSTASFNDANYEVLGFFGSNFPWAFTTTHHWGENSAGIWTLQVRDRIRGTTGEIQYANVRIYGTANFSQRVGFAAQRQSVLENAGRALIRVENIGGTREVVTVRVRTFPQLITGAAIPGRNYEPLDQTLIFNPGETFKEVAIPLVDNVNEDGNSFVYVMLDDPTGAALSGISLLRLDIVDDEANAVTVVPGDRTLSETGNGSDTGTFVISRTRATAETLVIPFTLSGTAGLGTDYKVNSNSVMSVTLGPGVASSTVTVTPIDDDLLEGTESVILTISPDPPDGKTRYGVGVPGSAQIDIRDTDIQLIEIQAIDNSASEEGDDPGVFRVTRKHPRTFQPLKLDKPVVVNLAIGGNAQPGRNYLPIDDRVVIPANSDHVDIVITPIDDAIYLPNQLVVVKLAPDSEYGFGFSTDATVHIAENDPIPDPNKPSVAIDAPASETRIPGPAASVIASGTADDNQEVARVTYQLNNGPVQTAVGTTHWRAEIAPDLVAGVNTLRVRAVDQFNNSSPVATRTFIYALPVNLTVTATAGGKVATPGFLGQTTRAAGVAYDIAAKPQSKKFVFAGWSGDVVGVARALTFVMPAQDAVLTANFIANPFTSAVTGHYEGLLRATPFLFEGSGFLRLNLTSTGEFSAVVIVGEGRYRIKGAFTGNQPAPGFARFRRTIATPNLAVPLEVDLILEFDHDGEPQLTGAVTPADATFFAKVTAGRRYFDKKNRPFPAANYTVIIAPIENATARQPHGVGWATLRIDESGNLRWSGALPDGTKASQTTFLTKTKTWPLFATPYDGKGVVIGNVALDEDSPDNDLNGRVDWFKPPINDSAAIFSAGFAATDVNLVGSRYLAPGRGERVLAMFDGVGTLSFREGYLDAGGVDRQFDLPIMLSTTNLFTFPDGNLHLVTASVSPKTGVFRGTFAHPLTFSQNPTPTPFSGVIFQRKQPGAAAQFTGEIVTGGSFQTGRVLLTLPHSSPPTVQGN